MLNKYVIIQRLKISGRYLIRLVCGPMGMRGKSPYPHMARCGRIRAIRSYAYGPVFTSLNYIFISFLIIYLIIYLIVHFIIFYDAITSTYISIFN